MSFFVCFVFVINIVFICVYIAVAQDIVNSICWKSNVQCNIEANLTRDTFSTPFLVNFNCTDDVDQLAKDHSGIRLIQGVKMITLNGCNVTQNDTIGIEHIYDPKSVTHLTIYLFKIKTFYSKHLDKFKSVVALTLIDNVFEEIIDESFQDIISVETLVISNNNLKVIAPYAYVPLNNLKNLTIIEPNLSIETLNFTCSYSLKHIWLEVYAYEWQVLPKSLETLEIIDTKLTFSEKTLQVENCRNLTTITITNSQFNGFPAIESASLKVLNLTQNNLHQIFENNLPNLEVLDVSSNELKEINGNTFKTMGRLREIYANDNRVEKISKKAFDFNTHLKIIKIAGNRLKSMEFTDHLAERPLQIFIDDNPWSCTWVINVSSEYPTIFAIFHYRKYTKNQLSVNGLNCLHYGNDGYNIYDSSIPTEIIPISSTLPFADNIEISQRRNPKDTALITITILLVGVIFLFFLLYLHIKCRENTVEPFYRSLPYDTHQMSDRIDIIRRNLPPTDYEAPIAARDADLKEVIYEQIPEKFTNYERIPEKFTVHEGFDGFDDVNSVLSYKIAMKNSES